jgi:hypothetical protein
MIMLNDNKTLESLFHSIEPDNINFPKTLNFNMEKSGRALIIELISNEFNMTLLSTMDEVLESTQTFLDTIKELG